MNKSIPPFYVGQKVVAVCNHVQGHFKMGDEFTINSVEIGCCGWDVTIGITSHGYGLCICTECHKMKLINIGEEISFCSTRFAPITSTFQSIEYREVLEKEREFVSAN